MGSGLRASSPQPMHPARVREHNGGISRPACRCLQALGPGPLSGSRLSGLLQGRMARWKLTLSNTTGSSRSPIDRRSMSGTRTRPKLQAWITRSGFPMDPWSRASTLTASTFRRRGSSGSSTAPPVWSRPTPPELDGPMYPIVNLALGSGWPIDKTPNPSRLLVDYVHVYGRDAGPPEGCPPGPQAP